MKIKRLLFYFLLLVTVAGCFEQKPQKVSKSRNYSSEYKFQSKQCAKLDLHRSVFTHKNLINIFQCLGWSQEFPRVTEFIQSFNEQEFDNFTKTYNAKFFSSKVTEDNYYRLLKKVNNKEFVEQGNKLAQLLTREDIIQLFSRFIDSSEDPNWLINELFLDLLPFYMDLKGRVGNTTFLKKYAGIFSREDSLLALETMAMEFTTSLLDQKHRGEVLKFLSDGSWPRNYVQALSGDDMVNLNTIFTMDFFDVRKNLFTLVEFAENQSDRKCSIGSQEVLIDHTQELYEGVRAIIEKSPGVVLYDLAELVEKFGLYKNICSNSNAEYIRSSEGILKKALEVLMVRGSFEFFKEIMKIKVDTEPKSVLSFFKVFLSDFFLSYHDLVKIIHDSESTQIYNDALTLLKKFRSEDYEKIRSMLANISEGLNERPNTLRFVLENNKELLIDLYADLMINDLSFSDSLEAYLELTNFMPQTANDREFITQFFVKMVHANKDENFRKELLKFLSEDSLFKFTSLIGRSNSQEIRFEAQESDQPLVMAVDLFSNECTERIRSLREIDFDSLVESGLFDCAQNTEDYFFYNIYKWTVDVDLIFREQFNHKFSVNYGIVSPKMMGFYLNLILVINEHLYTPDRNYILETVHDIKDVLEDQSFLKTMSSSVQIVEELNARLNVTQYLVPNLINARHNGKIDNARISKALDIVLSKEQGLNKVKAICEQLNPEIANLSCLSKNQFLQYFEDIVSLLITKNKNGDNALRYVTDMLYGEDFKIPVGTRFAKEYTLTLTELANFFNDANSEATKKEISINNNNSFKKHQLTLSQRLEVLIRDIAFNDNFYGIYFMNVASKARQYMREMNKLRTQLRLMVGSAGMFRRFRVFDPESRWKFRNVWNTYPALTDLDGPFLDADSKEHSYVNLIQAIMASTVKASDPGSVEFHPYRTPNPALVKSHKGHLITKLSEVSFITRMSLLLSRMGSKITKERSVKLDTVWTNLTSKIDSEKLETFLQNILSSKNLKLIAADLYDLQERMSPSEINILLDTGMNFLSDYLVQTPEPMKVFDLIEFVVENYPSIKRNFSGGPEILSEKIVEKLSELMSQQWLNEIAIDVSNDILTEKAKIKELLISRSFGPKIIELIKEIDAANFLLDTKMLREVLTDPKLDWVILIDMLKDVSESELGTAYLDNVLKVMSQKDEAGTYRMEIAFREIFKDTEALESFLRNVFNKVKLAH